jgi:hypothetical protein
MTKGKLISLRRKILNTDSGLDFLAKLEQTELEKLIVLIRDRIEGARCPS